MNANRNAGNRLLALPLSVLLLGSPGAACNNGRGLAGNDTLQTDELSVTTLAGDFDTIWDLAWGPDNSIWVTERGGGISRVDPATGAITRVGSVQVSEIGEGGLMGLTFHPDFATQPWVYVAHTYSSGGTRNRVVRMRYDGADLADPEVVIDNLPGSSIHNGSRLAIGPDRKLYVTTGDASNTGLPQDRSSTAGKVLRLELDGGAASGNPFGNTTWSLGHRNPQGMVFLPDGSLFLTEHGPSDNDEINRVEAGRNFGWPNVHGKCDGDTGGGEQAFCQANNVVEPLASWTPTIAPAGMDYYNATLIPGWQGSLLFVALKGAALYRMPLSSDGRRITGEEVMLQGQYGRLRDVLVGPDGTVYLGTSNRDGRGSPRSGDDRVLRVRPR
jgi:glucose/arabinose dehydrogenase